MGMESSWFKITGLAAVMMQIKQTGDMIMATLEDIQAQVAQANAATNDIANDIRSLKEQLDTALQSTAGQVDEQVQAQLDQVSQALDPLVNKLEAVAGQTDSGDRPDNTLPEPE